MSLLHTLKTLLTGKYRITGPVISTLPLDTIRVCIGDMYDTDILIHCLDAWGKKNKKQMRYSIYSHYDALLHVQTDDLHEGKHSSDMYLIASRLYGETEYGNKRLTDSLWAGIPRNRLIVLSEDPTFRSLAQENNLIAIEKMKAISEISTLDIYLTTMLLKQ
jgi:hypothetical protein